jgi:hypothetical protein
MSNSEFNARLIKAINEFETDYKKTLNESNIDDNMSHVFYELGADIKHAFDSFKDEIVTEIEK